MHRERRWSHSSLRKTPSSSMEKDFLQQSLNYLEKLGPQARDAVPTLVRIFRKVEKVRPQVLLVLNKIGPAAREETRRLGDELHGGTLVKSQPDFSPRTDENKPVSFSPPNDLNWKPMNDTATGKSVATPAAVVNPSPGRPEPNPTFPVVSGPPFEKFLPCFQIGSEKMSPLSASRRTAICSIAECSASHSTAAAS